MRASLLHFLIIVLALGIGAGVLGLVRSPKGEGQ